MAPKKTQFQVPSSDSEDGQAEMMQGMMGGGGGAGADPSRFFNKNYHREYMAKLPAKIQDRTRLLMSLDTEFMAKKDAFEKKKNALRIKYDGLYGPLVARRREIVTGSGEGITEEEIQKGFPSEHAGKVDIAADEEKDGKKESSSEEKGVPGFWLDCLRHHVIIQDMITDKDEEILETLEDIQVMTMATGFKIVFCFAEDNGFFVGTEIAKTVHTKIELGSIGIDRTEETTVNWLDGKNPTVETITKKQRNKKKGAVRTTTSTEPCESFFNLFSSSEEQEEMEQWCSLAMTIHQKIAPFAVEYVTGEAPDGSSDIEDDDDDDMYGMDDEEDDDDDDSEEDAMMPRRAGRGGGGGRSGKSAPASAPPGKECKQQ